MIDYFSSAKSKIFDNKNDHDTFLNVSIEVIKYYFVKKTWLLSTKSLSKGLPLSDF